MTKIQRSRPGCFISSGKIGGAFLAAFGFASNAFATGYFGPTEYFASHDKPADATPEFYWAVEVDRLAQE